MTKCCRKIMPKQQESRAKAAILLALANWREGSLQLK